MTLEELGSALKSNVESIGLEIWGSEVFHQLYGSDDWCFTIEAAKTYSFSQLQKQARQLKGILDTVGIKEEMLTHCHWGVGRGKIWYSCYMGIKGSALRRLLRSS